MNITFLIGNGFDVGVGMKSNFKDFFPIYKDLSKNKPERIKQLSNEIEEDYETWSDFESALGEYTTKFNLDTKQDFIDQVKDFESNFISYLKNEEYKLSYDDSDSISHTMCEALTKYYSIDNLALESNNELSAIYANRMEQNHIYNFINFNYTDVLKNCLDTIPEKIVCKRNYKNVERTDTIGEIMHIHGKSNMHPIIGLNDVSQIANEQLSNDPKFTKLIVKPSLNKFLRLGNDKKATKLINDSTIICVYGMSLGNTDKKWWDTILSWLYAVPSRQLVLFDYDSTYASDNQFGWIEKEDAIIEKLSQYNSNNSVYVENLRPRIHIAIHRNIFQMDLRTEKSWISDVISAI